MRGRLSAPYDFRLVMRSARASESAMNPSAQWRDNMARAVPLYSRAQVNKAAAGFTSGKLKGAELDSALDAINNWRSSHSFPLNTFAVRLRLKGLEIDPECLTAQRIKRLSSIVHKIERFPNLPLSQMQDIGGCRAVMTDIDYVHSLVEVYTVGSDLKHTHCLGLMTT